jgi:hypothetical protein
LIDEQLFRSKPWRADWETIKALMKKLGPLGLDEPVPGPRGTRRPTAPGSELNDQLMEAFMGVWEPFEVPYILHENGLISVDEKVEAENRIDRNEDVDTVLLPLVRRAYVQYFQAGTKTS